ncbi:MAG TPA: hypothetical protein VLE49_01305 [Anaerolineales bacterium]|nr:hypothetical protein [Anaerolineales bacterium]
MKRIFPYPLVLISAVILDRVAISSSQIGIDQSLRALSVLLVLAAIITLMIQYFVKDWRYTNFIVLMIPVALIAYRSLYRFLKTSFPHQANALGIALLVLLGVLYAVIVRRKVWKSLRNPARVTTYFNVVFIVLLIFQLVRLAPAGYHMLTKLSQPQTTVPVLGPDFKLHKGSSSPDIYVIILDGYARQDVLQTIYKHDNSEFIAELEKRGFYVANSSHSNYVQTVYTMSSFWNLDYLTTWEASDQYVQYLFEPIQKNRVYRALHEIGYTTVSFAGAVHYTGIKNSDVYLSNFLPLNDFESLLLVDSPIEPLSNLFDLGIPVQTYKTHRQRTLYQLDTLKEIPASIPGPKIVYAHILAPHPPFAFYQNGDIRDQQRPYTLAEGTGRQGGLQEYWYGYQEQVKFINREILKVIDAILQKSKSPPVILLMGDHGPASMFNFDPQTPGCLWERTSILYAISLPGHENDNTVYPSISPVNTFRVIFNTYFGTDLPLLEDRSYLMYWYDPKVKVDITDVRDSLNGCTPPSH